MGESKRNIINCESDYDETGKGGEKKKRDLIGSDWVHISQCNWTIEGLVVLQWLSDLYAYCNEPSVL